MINVMRRVKMMIRMYYCDCGEPMLEINNPWTCSKGHIYGDPHASDEESGIIIAVNSKAEVRYFAPQHRDHTEKALE